MIHQAKAIGLLLVASVMVASCGISTEGADPDDAPVTSAQQVEAIADFFPTLAYLSPAQLGEKLGVDVDGLGSDPEATAAAIVASGANVQTAGVDTTISLSRETVMGVRAAWIEPILAPFAVVRDALAAGDLDAIPPVPALDFTVREVATGLECRATAAPWLHVTRDDFPPFPARRNNESKDGYTSRVTNWINSVAAIESTVVAQLEAWVRGVPRRSGTSDPLCYVDAERDRQVIAGIEDPETTLVTDYLVTGDIDDVGDLSGMRINLLFACDAAGSTEDPRECNDTAATAVENLTDLGAVVVPLDTNNVLAAAGSGEQPDQDAVLTVFAQLSDEAIADLITDPINNAFQGGF